MEIKLKTLRLLNFKGIRDKTFAFEEINNLSGANATGKTTVIDAFTWLLFGKDSSDREKFEVKTLDENNRVIPKINHEVEGVILIDGEKTVLKKELLEDWTTKRGSSVVQFTGNSIKYYWNGVPKKESEYQAKIADLLNDKTFKLVTNPLYFNDKLKPEERRKVLLQVAGDITDEDIAEGNESYQQLLTELGRDSLSDFRKKKAAEKKILKQSLEQIPARIDEATRAMPDIIDFKVVEKNLTGKRQELAGIEQQINDSVEALKATHEIINGKQTEIHNLQTKINGIEFEVRQAFINKKSEREGAIVNLKRSIRDTSDELNRNKSDYINADARKSQIVKEQDDLRVQWQQLNNDQSELLKKEFEFNESACICPTCQQKLPEDNIQQQREKLESNFTADKNKRSNTFAAQLKNNTETGQRLGAEVTELDKRLSAILQSNEQLTVKAGQLQTELTNLEVQHQNSTANEDQELTKALQSNADLSANRNKIESLQAEIEALKPQQQSDDLKQKKQVVQSEIEALQKQLNTKEQIELSKKRIAVLNDEQRDLAQQIADIEQKEFLIEGFEKAKSDELVNRVNGMFDNVTFRLFREQINGGLDPCCDTIFKGVDWSNLNTAGKVWAGLEIINVLNKHFNVSAPIFLDNRESVSEIPETDSQIINLIVSPDDMELKIAHVYEHTAGV